jgi:hypothetical protein
LLAPMSEALTRDNYQGVVSLESVFHSGNSDFEAGFRKCIDLFRNVFG